MTVPDFFERKSIVGIKLYEVDEKYVDFLLPYAPHLFMNKKPGQHNTRKYIGVILIVNGLEYFAPLSSFKPKHKTMKPGVDFLKIGTYAVINLNNMFPVPKGHYTYVDIRSIRDLQYRKLVESEYRIIRSMQDKILKNAKEVYKHKCENENKTALAKRCNDFKALEKICVQYNK